MTSVKARRLRQVYIKQSFEGIHYERKFMHNLCSTLLKQKQENTETNICKIRIELSWKINKIIETCLQNLMSQLIIKEP